MIQMWPRLSTATPDTWPSIQLFGSGFGQNGSTWNCGTPPAFCAAAALTTLVPGNIVTRCSAGTARGGADITGGATPDLVIADSFCASATGAHATASAAASSAPCMEYA